MSDAAHDAAHEAALLATMKEVAPVLGRYGWDTPLKCLSEMQVRDLIETAVCHYELARWGRTNMVPF